MKEVNLVHE